MTEDLAKVKWTLYLMYGLEPFDNRVLLKRDKLNREDIVQTLTFESVREKALNALEGYRKKIEELEAMLAEATAEEDR